MAWQRLINPVKGIETVPWPGNKEKFKIPPLTPELCNRFVLSNPHVQLEYSLFWELAQEQ